MRFSHRAGAVKRGSSMKKGLRVIGIIVVAVVGFSLTGCVTAAGVPPTKFPAISDYTFIPSKNYVVVGAVVVRNTSHETLIADLMDQAIAMGGHDVINIRVGWRDVMGHREISTATAVVIRFTDETLVEGITVTEDGTTTQHRFVRRGDAILDAPPVDAGGRRGIRGR